MNAMRLILAPLAAATLNAAVRIEKLFGPETPTSDKRSSVNQAVFDEIEIR
jgi:hypothetical protein